MNLQDNMLIAVDALPRVSISLSAQTPIWMELWQYMCVINFFSVWANMWILQESSSLALFQICTTFSHMEQNETYMWGGFYSDQSYGANAYFWKIYISIYNHLQFTSPPRVMIQ